LVVDYIRHEGIEVQAAIALAIDDNVAVGARDPLALLDDVDSLDVKGVDAVVLSACVQMPSLAAIARAEDKLGLPVVSASICTARKMMRVLGVEPVVPGMGYFLSERNLTPNSLAGDTRAAE
jgi:maleate isomerase